MNSVIDAMDEYIQYNFIPRILYPGMPVTRDELDTRIWENWQNRNHKLVHKQLGKAWDNKLLNEQTENWKI